MQDITKIQPGSVIQVILSGTRIYHLYVREVDSSLRLDSGAVYGGTKITKDGFKDMRSTRTHFFIRDQYITRIISPENVKYAYPYCQQRI